MRVEVEPSGCCERKGMVQIRFCFYLEPGDYGYKIHHIKIDGKWQNNPFHNHFIYVEPDTTDKEIMDIGEAFLKEAYEKWSANKGLDLKNKSHALPVIDDARRTACEAKVRHLKSTTLERSK